MQRQTGLHISPLLLEVSLRVFLPPSKLYTLIVMNLNVGKYACVTFHEHEASPHWISELAIRRCAKYALSDRTYGRHFAPAHATQWKVD